jgi:hypothetical protein
VLGYDRNDWKRNWKGLLVGFLAGTLVAWLIFGLPDVAKGGEAGATTTQTQTRTTAYRDCWDTYHCNTPRREHARAFRHRAYGKTPAAKQVAWSRWAKRRILSRAKTAWYNRGLDVRYGLWNGRAQWRNFTSRDNCYSTGYPTNIYHCKVQALESKKWRERDRRWRARIGFCGAGMVPAIATGGAWLWVGYGAGHCLWGFSLD